LKKLLVAALLCSALAAPAYAAELVTNGGFEDTSTNFAGWNFVPSNTLSLFSNPANPAVVHGGVYAAYFIAPTGSYDWLSQNLKTVAGQTYDYSFWLSAATTDETAPSEFYVQFGSQTMLDLQHTGTFGYTEFSGSFVAASNVTEIYFEGANSLGLYLLDDISVTSRTSGSCVSRVACDGGGGGVPEPATWALMISGFGLAGAALRRRRALTPA